MVLGRLSRLYEKSCRTASAYSFNSPLLYANDKDSEPYLLFLVFHIDIVHSKAVGQYPTESTLATSHKFILVFTTMPSLRIVH